MTLYLICVCLAGMSNKVVLKVDVLLYMCCLSPCAQPFCPVVMTLVSELEVRGSNLSI